MAQRVINRAKDFLKEGSVFTYENFATKSSGGYPRAYTTEYYAWKTKVESYILSIFGKSSPFYEAFKKGDDVAVFGNGPDQFSKQNTMMLGALNAIIDTLEFEPVVEDSDSANVGQNNKVFIVHAHDEQLKHQLEIFLTELGLEPIVLHRKPDEGLTVIEKFEKHSNVGYAFVLLTPDDIAYLASEEDKREVDRKKEARARQNVVFEFGYFLGKLGRKRVCCLYKEGVVLPSDISGIIYKKVHNSVEEAAFSILKDLKAVGYQVTL
jgi:predicted nucleotide-binding protein